MDIETIKNNYNIIREDFLKQRLMLKENYKQRCKEVEENEAFITGLYIKTLYYDNYKDELEKIKNYEKEAQKEHLNNLKKIYYIHR
jgi:hypothetical protein